MDSTGCTWQVTYEKKKKELKLGVPGDLVVGEQVRVVRGVCEYDPNKLCEILK